MNVLFICNEYPPGKSGGIGSSTRNLAREIVRNGHQVFVAGLYMPGYGQKDYEETDGIKVFRKRLSIDIGLFRNNYTSLDNFIWHSLRLSGVLSRSFNKAMRDFNSFLYELIVANNIDIIEWPDYNECFAYANEKTLSFNLPIPIIIKLHGTPSYVRQQLGQPVDKLIYAAEKKHIHSADAIIAVSSHTARQYSVFYEIDQKIQVLYNSVPGKSPGVYKEHERIRIIFTGSISKLKGMESLLKAWNRVHEKHPLAELQIFGKGRPGKFIRFLNKQAKQSVRFMGYAREGTLTEAFSNATAAIFPSYIECFSIAPLEAMSNGCPVIFTDRASGPELINNGVNGLLVNPDNPSGMADAINSLISNRELRLVVSKNGRETIEKKFNITDSAKAHLVLYKSVIRRHQLKNPGISIK